MDLYPEIKDVFDKVLIGGKSAGYVFIKPRAHALKVC